ncbi:MAG: hypothetical protein DWH91_08775 [Planctomycetota bacterium]|nr:MAG: hypothetical protein DWH91_08775 [Planctomycetota bacterium]
MPRPNLLLPRKQTSRPVLDYLCIVSAVFAMVITAIPSMQSLWSRSTYPTLARMDQQLERYGVTLLPARLPADVTTRPMMAVILGKFEPERAEQKAMPPSVEALPPHSSKSIVVPASWSPLTAVPRCTEIEYPVIDGQRIRETLDCRHPLERELRHWERVELMPSCLP